MKAKDIVRDIDKRFFKDKNETKKTLDGILRVLNDFFERENLDRTTGDVIDFLKEIWGHFSIGKYTNIFVDFAKAEKALYGFGERYRDHLMHVFNVHLLGLLTFSRMIRQEENKAFQLLKIQEEPDKVPFPSKYSKHRRLYYLWCLISTFHDIAIPIDYRGDVIKGLGRYFDYFRIETEELGLKFPFMTQFDISRYSDLMSRLFAKGVSLSKSDEVPTYDVEDDHSGSYLYFRSVLTSDMNKYNHGVLGAYFLYRSIEEMFLSGKNPNLKYDLDLCDIVRNGKPVGLPEKKREWDEFLEGLGISEQELERMPRVYDLGKGETKAYNDYVFEQDVTRAALAIALHNIDYDVNPKIFPLRFSKFPLTSLLILFDELQEFYRPEGLVLTEVVRCRKFPQIDVNLESSHEGRPRVKIVAHFDLEKPKGVIKELLNKYNMWAKNKKEGKVKSYGELVHATWRHIFDTISNKLAFEDGEPLEIYVNVTVEGEKPDGKSLEYKSTNWTNSL
jgi:hypothetical protein